MEIILGDNKYRFNTTNKLGQGAFGITYKGYDGNNGKEVAVKGSPLPQHFGR